MNIEEMKLNTMMVWIKLPGLQPRLWSTKNLSSIASFVGTPIATDRMTANRTRLDFARVLVEVKIGAEHPIEIPIEGPNGTTIQPVIYEWRLQKCSKCGRLGHEAEQCRAKPTVPEPATPVVPEVTQKSVEPASVSNSSAHVSSSSSLGKTTEFSEHQGS